MSSLMRRITLVRETLLYDLKKGDQTVNKKSSTDFVIVAAEWDMYIRKVMIFYIYIYVCDNEPCFAHQP